MISGSSQNEMDENPEVSRRHFLNRGLWGGVGAGLLISNTKGEQNSPQYMCGGLAAADAVFMYIELLYKVERSVLLKLVTTLSATGRDFSMAFGELHCLIKALETEICKTKKLVNAQEMRQLTEGGLACSQLVNNTKGVTDSNMQGYVTVLAAINEQVAKSAQCFLPDGKYEISAEATKIINKLLLQTEVVKKFQERLNQANDNYTKEYRSIGEKTEQIRTDLRAAIQAIFDAEEAYSNGKDSKNIRERAKKSLDDPIRNLEKLAKEQRQEQEDLPVKLLIILLKGIQYWIENPGTMAEDTAQQATSSADVKFVKVASNSEPLRLKSIESIIKSLLKKHCGPGTDVQILACKAAATGVFGWRKALHPDLRLKAINFALSTAGQIGRLPCDRKPMPNLNALAEALSDLAPKIT